MELGRHVIFATYVAAALALVGTIFALDLLIFGGMVHTRFLTKLLQDRTVQVIRDNVLFSTTMLQVKSSQIKSSISGDFLCGMVDNVL
jgi:hypothetical protein